VTLRLGAVSRSWRIVSALAWASLVANALLVVTGGAVRLTGSGLGCPTWPECGGGSYVTHDAYGVHGVIEFGNRMLTFVLALVAVATLVSVLTARPYRRGPVLLALGLFLGIPAQAVIGGITVLTKLNPWVVMLHLMCSLAMVGAAMLLVVRVREGDAPPRSELALPLRRLSQALLALVLVISYLGAVVTGSGPHAGDLEAKRTGLDPDRMSQLHADGVFLLVGLTVALLVAVHAAGAPAAVRRSAAVLLGVEVAQAVIGFLQFFTGLPAALVAAHMLGATVLVAAAVHLVLSTRTRSGHVPAARPGAPAPRPAVAARS
jgi:cytochrome c oxidase assembly protein subunit 15